MFEGNPPMRLDENGEKIVCSCYSRDGKDEEGRLLCVHCFNVATQIIVRNGERISWRCAYHGSRADVTHIEPGDLILNYHEWLVWSVQEET